MTLQITTLNLVLLIFGTITVFTIGISLIINAEKFRYEEQIIFFEEAIKNFIVTKENYLELSKEYDKILRNNCDPKRTKRAYKDFLWRFKDVIE